jgi:hypothetical protein
VRFAVSFCGDDRYGALVPTCVAGNSCGCVLWVWLFSGQPVAVLHRGLHERLQFAVLVFTKFDLSRVERVG